MLSAFLVIPSGTMSNDNGTNKAAIDQIVLKAKQLKPVLATALAKGRKERSKIAMRFAFTAFPSKNDNSLHLAHGSGLQLK